MTLSYVDQFMQKIDLQPPLVDLLRDLMKQILADEALTGDIEALGRIFWEQNCDIYKNEVCRVAAQYGLSKYLLQALCCILWSEQSWKLYKERGISEEIFWDSMSDLKAQIRDSESIHYTPGLENPGWFWGFLRGHRIRLGRFEYQMMTPSDDWEIDFMGVRIPTDRDWVSIHIPSGESITRERRLASYKKAYDYFADHRMENGWLPMHTDSWLIYPGNKKFMDPNSNIVDFTNDFIPIFHCDYYEGQELWRVFGGGHDFSKPETLPQANSLRRAYVEHLKNGGCSGVGVGVLLFDGERVLTNTWNR